MRPERSTTMRVLVLGGTGTIGRALVPALQRRGHTVVVWQRPVARARARLGADIEPVDAGEGLTGLTRAVESCHAVIDLAHDPVLARVWTGTSPARRPRVLVSVAGVADLFHRSEARLRTPHSLGIRTVALRSGIVVGRDGGRVASALARALPWIHLHDLVALIVRAIHDDRVRGCVDATAPGRRADELAFPTRAAAFADLAGGAEVTVIPLRGPVESTGSEIGRRYLERRRPAFELRTATLVPAPVDQTFSFFCKAENLGLLTPSGMRFSIAGRAPAIDDNVTIDYRMRVGPLPLRWRSRIVDWTPGVRFVDLQERGPYRAWWHEHQFQPVGSWTLMIDRVCYAPPFGGLGRLVNRLFIVPVLRRIFQYRADVIRLRFGDVTDVVEHRSIA